MVHRALNGSERQRNCGDALVSGGRMLEIAQIDSSFTRNPMTVLRRLQEKAPVGRAVMWGSVPVWLVTRYDEARALLADPRLSKDGETGLSLLPPNNSGELTTELTSHMLQADPPDHTRLRKLVVKAFTARAVERLRSQIETIADRLDINRKPNSHMAFGHGIQHCVGATRGRIEGRIAIARLLDHFEDLELATTGPIEHRDSTIIHGLTTLPVRCHFA
jgi:cytochrome P450